MDVSFVNPDEESEGGLAQWKWKNNEETQMLYSWEEVPNWEEEDTWVLQPVSTTK